MVVGESIMDTSAMQALSRVDVAIIGGGIAGLVCAYRLRQCAPDLSIALFEASERLGGKALTERIETDAGTFIVEAGPDSLLTQKPWGLELVKELGLSDEVVPINSISPGVSVLKGGRLFPLPHGLVLLAPTAIGPFVRSRLLSVLGKGRVALEMVLPAAKKDGDESLAAFVARRFGRETLDWLAEPLMAGIYNAEPERLSLLATFPQFRQLERMHGSVIRGLRKTRRPSGNGRRGPAFVSLRGGMGRIAEALALEVSGIAHYRAAVAALDAGAERGARLRLSNGRTVSASVLVVATPAAQAADLLSELSPRTSDALRALRTVNAGNLSFAVRSDAVQKPPPGYGVVIPRREGRPINAVTFASSKFPGRAPGGWTLIRAFFGGARSPQTMELDDAEVTRLILDELRHLFGISGEPAFVRIHRWPAGSPQYDVGHLERIAAIEQSLPPGVYLTGSAYRGVGIPDLVREAGRAAELALRYLRTRAPIA